MLKNKPKIVFMGTSPFGVPALEEIHKEYGIEAVVTVPDKPAGRGLKLMPSAVKSKALELGLNSLQPVSLKDENFYNELEALQPDIIVVIAFRILPKQIFSLAKIAAFNIHASLLPKYRGAAPINWAIINGEKETGLTAFVLKEIVDTGDILKQVKIAVPDGCTAGDLHDMMMPYASTLAMETVKIIENGNPQFLRQDDTAATPAPKIFPDMCKIDWKIPAEKVRNFILGMSPFPAAYCDWQGKRMKILRADFNPNGVGNPGKYFIEKGKLSIHCDSGVIYPTEILIPGKKPMKIKDYLIGYRGNVEGIIE